LGFCCKRSQDGIGWAEETKQILDLAYPSHHWTWLSFSAGYAIRRAEYTVIHI
jgi:hypothetical protein